MNATIVIYGSSTGTCEAIAEKIASKLGCEALNVQDLTADIVDANQNLILGTSLLPFALLFYYCSVYVTQNRVRRSIGVILSEPLFILGTLSFMEYFCPEQFWWFFTVGVVIALAACLATAWMISRRNPMVDRFTLAPKTIDAPYIDYSLSYNEQDTHAAFLDIVKYLDICELSEGQSNRIAVCAEEMMKIEMCKYF